MKKLLLLLTANIYCLTLWADPNSQHPESLESLDNASVYSIYQDGTGAIWLSTNYGLYRYNGNSLELTYEELPQNSICGNSDDISFFAVSRDAFLRYDLQKGTMEKFSVSGVKYPYVASLCPAGTDSLYIGYNSSLYLHSGENTSAILSITDEKISSICRAGKDLVIGTENGSVFSRNHDGELSLKYKVAGEYIHALYCDSDSNIWIGTESRGAICLDSGFNEIRKGYKAGRRARTFCEDAAGNLYIGCLDGLFIVDKNGKCHRDKSISPAGHAICCVICDRDKNIWSGTYYSGVFLNKGAGHSFVNFPMPIDKDIRLINAMVMTADKSRYALTDHYGIWKITPEGRWTMIPGTGERKFKTGVYDDMRDCIWTGEHLGGLNRYDPATGKWTSYKFQNKSINSIFDIKQREGNLYLGTNSGVYIFDPSNEKVISRNIDGIGTLVFSISFAPDGTLWIGSRGLFKYRKDMGLISMDALKDIRCCWIDIAEDGTTYVATDGKGICLIKDGQCTFVGKQTMGLDSDFTYLVKKLNDNYVLAGSRIGISVFDTAKGICCNYRGSNGLGLSSTKDGGLLEEPDGTIVICGTDGIVKLPDGHFSAPSRQSDFTFDKMLINGSQADFESRLPFMENIRLDHNSTSISVEIASFNYASIYSERFEYCLHGLDETWTLFNPDTRLSWNNLKPGSYRLGVRMYQGSSATKEKNLSFIIRHAWYSSTVAIIAYVLIFIGIGAWLLSSIYKRMLLSEQLKRKEKENDERMRFFVNISHELRTPLTLITGQLELYFKSHDKDEKDMDKIESTYRNAQKMQSIVSDLLDFEKQNQGYTYIIVRETNLSKFLKDQRSSFGQYANFRNIDLQLSIPSYDIHAYIDECQMQKVFSNLLVNAFKFTNDGGKIKISLSRERYGNGQSVAVIRIADTGCGISEDALKMIFNPFFQDPESELSKRNQGSGIGLALCKGIVELHHGSISVQNLKSGGAEFTITLPLGEKWMEGDEKVRISKDLEKYSSPKILPDLYQKSNHISHDKTYKMLIVEDDDDMREMISSIFHNSYEVRTASDGSEGFSIAKSWQPDIIISDVMMPVMNGLSLCAKLREEFETCHIPVILLTAHYSVRTSLNGMDAGADAYIAKPFNIDMLAAKCRSLLENRELLRAKFCRSFTGIETLAKSDRDADLLAAAIEVIEANIQDQQLSVSTLCSELNMGRTILAEKIKGLTGMPPREFIESIKMKHAAQLIKEGNMRVSEVAYHLGFNDPKYFTIRFKKQFGVSPSQYATQS